MLNTYSFTGLKSLSIAGMLVLGLAAGLATGMSAQPAQAQAAGGGRGGGGGGGGGNAGGGSGNMDPDRVLGPQALIVGAPQCETRPCPPVKRKIAPIVIHEACAGVQPFYDRYGRLISQSCERRVPFAQ